MGNLTTSVNRLLHAAISICLSCMAIFVFANVILRYFFNSGLTWAEEASRYLFIWLIFLGSLIAYKENVHLGVDTLVRKLSAKNRRILFIINNLLLLVTMSLCVDGTWKITILTVDQVSASMRMPLSYVYVSGFIASAGMVAITLHNLYRLFTGELDEQELVLTSGEDQEKVDQAVGEAAGGAKKL